MNPMNNFKLKRVGRNEGRRRIEDAKRARELTKEQAKPLDDIDIAALKEKLLRR